MLPKTDMDMLTDFLLRTCDDRISRTIELFEPMSPRLVEAAQHLASLGIFAVAGQRRDAGGNVYTSFRLLDPLGAIHVS